MVPPSILNMFMEDELGGELLYQCSNHPALLQAQQPFVQILSSPSFSTSNHNRGNMEGSKDLLPVGSGDQSTLSSPFSKGVDVAGAFLKGVEEAIRFLPRVNSIRRDYLVNGESRSRNAINKRYNRDDYLEEEERRTRKTMVMMIEEPEEIGVHEILEEMMLRGYETCIKEMEKLQIALNNEGKKSKTRGGSKTERDVVDLPTLLIHCAQAVAANNHMIAIELLKQIKQNASTTGDARQRLAQCFAKGLEARLVGTGNKLWNLHMAERPSVVEFLKAYKMFMAACCFNKIALMFSIMTIMDAIVGKRRLHIVDYGMNYGFQWAGLIRCLAQRNGGQPELKITAIACSQNLFCPAQKIEEQGRWLSKCASEFGLPFKFHSIATDWEKVSIEDLNRDGDEVLIVNDLFSFRSLMDETLSFDNPSPRDTVLNNIRKMRPDVFIQSIVNCTYGSSFLSRFREALFYYTALFNMLDVTMPRESESRLVLEQTWFGRHVLNIIACEGADLVDRPEKYRQWQVRNQRAGLKQLPLKPDIVEVLKNNVKKHHKDFLVCEDGQWLLQGWMGRILFAHSAWVAEDPISE
ncbi:hypothetical protein EJB05_25626, partial [Eragrostis curvula]